MRYLKIVLLTAAFAAIALVVSAEDVNADGYEPDEIFTVGDGNDAEEFVFQMTALQVPATPTPEPTAEPTAEPTKAPVSSLPSTGTGSSDGSLLAGMAVIGAAMMTGVFVSRRQRVSC